MKKTTKIIAAASVLGVLGVAVLPVASYADSDVTLQLTVAASNTGDCTGAGLTATDNNGSAACEGTGGNNGTGYTWTIVDKDGAKLNMTTAVDGNGGTTGGLAPIAAPAAAISGTNVYGVKFGVTSAATSGYTGNLAGSTASGLNLATNVSAAPLSSNFLPVQATTASIKTNAAGLINIGATLGESHDSTLAAGVYKNTLTIQSAVANP
ncbi:hypothetical protein FACS189431_4870 [Alphaproteobacteria bacterium]|nr:hypothetical protein FACS189431_4870 [Alphaproteobacteria bacterium]